MLNMYSECFQKINTAPPAPQSVFRRVLAEQGHLQTCVVAQLPKGLGSLAAAHFCCLLRDVLGPWHAAARGILTHSQPIFQRTEMKQKMARRGSRAVVQPVKQQHRTWQRASLEPQVLCFCSSLLLMSIQVPACLPPTWESPVPGFRLA